jgi:hypothetical protein
LYTLSERVKLSLLCLLLLLMLGVLAFTAVNTFQAVQSFRQQYSEVKAGDVSTIHPWMTIHVVSQIYKVPEDYLYHSLQISYPNEYRHTTLYELASHKQQPVDQVIHTIQHAILTYRKIHPKSSAPAAGRKQDKNPPSPTPGRMHS